MTWKYAGEQWHLKAAHVDEAWALTKGDSNILIAIADDGVDTSHPEFAGRIAAQFDFSAQIADGNPKATTDRHGTACAGVAAAQGIDCRGGAPGCRLIAVRFPDQMGSVLEADMFHWMAENKADVILLQLGTAGRPGHTVAPAGQCRERNTPLRNEGTRWTRNSDILGGGQWSGKDLTDGYASNPDVIAVGATTDKDLRSLYSDFGDELSVCAPSSGLASASERAITTTDRTGPLGYNPTTETLAVPELPDTNYTNGFGGTSSATPLTAGVAALMLSANPNLLAAEVREILQKTADKVGGNPYDANGRNPLLGFGRINAKAAVAAATERTETRPGTTARDFSIQAPATLRGSDPAPTFRIATPTGAFYAVEVTTDPALFANAAGRTAANFFATWSLSGDLLSRPNYTLPDAIWQTFRTAGGLFYRLIVSDSAHGWANVRRTTTDADAANAPSIVINNAPVGTGPTVTGPAQASRAGAAPIFEVNPQPNFFYAVEIAADPALFDSARVSDRTAANYFATWTQVPSFTANPTYTLPDDTWQRMKAARSLSYRVWGSDAGIRWSNPRPSHKVAPFPTITINP